MQSSNQRNPLTHVQLWRKEEIQAIGTGWAEIWGSVQMGECLQVVMEHFKLPHVDAGGNRHLDKHRKCQVPILATIAVFMFIIATTLAILLAVEKSKWPLACSVPCCPDDWVGYRGKCYYFSETEGNWTYSWSQCSVLNASLVGIDSPQEKNFLMRYKGFLDYWIGLQSAPGQPWRLSNSTKLDQRSSIKGGGDCAYVYENRVSSSRCSTKRHWICSKSDARGRT